ncbi:MAG TPA: hypothetical protein PKY82_03525 [Pyrinomonadaceae bacterium]|nr:hypothetical protein [Pyrinomonadaceae bacterium]
MNKEIFRNIDPNFKMPIFGTLIVGDVAEGKTTVLAHYLNDSRKNLKGKMLIACPKTNSENLVNNSKTNSQKEMFFEISVTSPTVLERQFHFISEVRKLIEEEQEVGVIAIDEPSLFFDNKEVLKEFVWLMQVVNSKRIQPFNLLLICQSIDNAELLFGNDFVYGFVEFALLKSKPHPFFAQKGINQAEIKSSTFLRLQRKFHDSYEVLPLLSFTPGQPEKEIRLVPNTFPQKLLAMFGFLTNVNRSLLHNHYRPQF